MMSVVCNIYIHTDIYMLYTHTHTQIMNGRKMFGVKRRSLSL